MLGEAGTRDVPHHRVELGRGDQVVGSLVLGLRPGERSLSPKDVQGVALLTGPLALAVHATTLSEELQLSRERQVTAVEEERRRLRRELHDDLGPGLTGLALSADAAANLRDTDPERADELVRRTQVEARRAIDSVRRVVDQLRPPRPGRARSGRGAAAAGGAALLPQRRQPADRARRQRPLPVLPAALEVAVYRVATEALTNVARHATATSASLTVRYGDELEVCIRRRRQGGRRLADPASACPACASGSTSSAAGCEAGPDGSGGRVVATFPLVTP